MLLERYEGGDFNGAWDALRAGEGTVEEERAVAGAIMRRVAQNVDMIVARLDAAGFRFANGDDCRIHPTEEDMEAASELPALIGGDFPVALMACLSIVGEVSLCGTHPSWHPPTYCFDSADEYPTLSDPLVLPSARWVRDELVELRSDEAYERTGPLPLSFAPDELHKAGISGSTHDLLLPDSAVDPVLHRVADRPNITLVDYLRVSLRWGGFPGFEFARGMRPSLIRELAVDLIPF